MFVNAPYKGELVSRSHLRAGLLASLAILLGATSLFGARFRGQARHEFLEQIPVAGAQIEIVDANDPTQTATVFTDALGFFETAAFDAGDQLEITATHPAYAQETPTVTLTGDDHFESILMTPLGDVLTDYHDIIVQISGAVTQLPLAGIPVQVTRWDSSSGSTLLSTQDIVTDAKGLAVLRGVRSGFYEFKLNDSSLPNTERRARYEDYATPPDQRVEITANHFMNVFLKPLKQDLRVVVTGYNFETRENNVPLGEVLVELRGLDPADTDREVLHARSDYTKLFPPGPTPTVTDDEFLISDGEVVFQGLPPVAYEVKITRYGYITKTLLLEPDSVTGLLARDADNPLQVYLSRENHEVDVVVDYPDYHMATFDQSGLQDGTGVTGLGLRTRLVGIENTNTDGLEYETYTVQNLNGETYAPFIDPILAGRYRVYLDGISSEQPVRYNADYGYFNTIGYAYDVGATGESIIEVAPGYTGSSPKINRFTVELETPPVYVRGQLMAAESIEPVSGEPIFRPLAHQSVEIISNPSDPHQVNPTTAVTETDADGRFSVRVHPGLYGIHLPGLTDYFGDAVIVHTGDAVRPSDANRTRTFQWPLTEPFPEVPGATASSLQAYRYFAMDGFPISAGRDQFLELRVRRESYVVDTSGSEYTDLTTKVIALNPSTLTAYEADYSPTLSNQTEITLQGSAGNFTTVIQPQRPGSFNYDPLFVRWENLPPGDYTGMTATVPAHVFSTSYFNNLTFIDWPVPGEAPTPELAALFDAPNLPNGQLMHEPLERVFGSGFEISPEEYEPTPFNVYVWDEREENGVFVEKYYFSYEATGGYPLESTTAGGYFGGYAELGGSINAVWTTGRNADDETYPVRMTPGGSLFLGGPTPSPPSALPNLTYSLKIVGVAATDQALEIDGAHYEMSSGRSILTGELVTGLQEDAYFYKAGGDNYSEQFQSGLRIVENSANPVLEAIVGLEQGMQVTATLRDMTPVGSSGTPIDIPVPAGIPVEIHNRYGRLLATESTDEAGQVLFEGLPGYADYFLSVDQRGYTPIRRRLLASEATIDPESPDTAAVHDITQDVVLLPRPTLHEPGIPLNRWGLFLPTVSRSGDVDAENNLNDFNFFAAKEALTAKWQVEVTPHQLNVTLPGFDNAAGAAQPDDTLSGPDTIVAAYLIDERRFQKDGFVGGTDPLENETVFDIPPDDEPAQLATLVQTIKETARIQNVSSNGYTAPERQRRVFVDEADKIELNADTGRTVVSGEFLLWDLPPGDFDPVIVLETQRGAYRVYDVPYDGDDAAKRLRGPNLPPWFANLLDLLGIASGVSTTQGRLEEALKDYVPSGTFVPLPDFSATITVDKPDADKDEGYLQYAFTLAMSDEIGQDSKSDGLLALGPGIIGAKTKVEAKLSTDGQAGTTAFTLSGTVTKDNLIDEAYGTKIAPIGGSSVSFENPTGLVSTTASTNYPAGASDQDPLKFSLSATAGLAATAKVSATLNNYGRAIPYAGPVIGVLGDTNLAKLDAFIEGRAAISQTFTLDTEFPRARKVRTRPRDEPVPRRSFLGETKIDFSQTTCLGVGFATGLELTTALGYATATVAFDVGGAGCSVNEDISTMELKFNPTGGWPFITEIAGEAKITAEASAGVGPAQIKGEWEFAKTEFKVQFGTETIVTHYPFTADFQLGGGLTAGEGLFVPAGPELVVGLAPGANFAVQGDLTDTLVYTAHDPVSGHDILRVAHRTAPGQWSDATEIDLGQRVGVTTSLLLGDGRTLLVYSVLADGQDPYDPYADHVLLSRLIGPDGSVGAEITVAFLSNPPTALRLAESGSRVELHTKAPATDGSAHYWQLFLTPFDPDTYAWGSTAFRVNEAEDFTFSLTAGGPDGADEILLHWVTESGAWKWLRSTESTPQTVSGTFSGAPASWATAAFYEIVAPTTEGTIRRYGQTALTGAPSLRETPLVTGVDAVEVGLTQQSVTASGGYLVAWIERLGNRQRLAYLTYDPDGNPTTDPLPVTDNPRGVYSDLRLTRQNATAAYAFARFTNGDLRSLRIFELDLLNGLADNDADADGLPDPAELRLVDADPTDAIESIDDVLDGDDFDGDGASNGDEIRAGSDPLDAFSLPGPPVVTLALLDATAGEWLADPASFTVGRSNSAADLPVVLTYTGTATAIDDYSVGPDPLVIAAGESSATVTVTPATDDLAEGPETVIVTLEPDAAYELGATTSLTLSLADRPVQQWQVDQFGADANTARALAANDEDGDGIINLLEYVFLLDPSLPDGPAGPQLAVVEFEGQLHLELQLTLNTAATDTDIILEGSADLSAFSDVGDQFTVVSTNENPDGTTTTVLRSTAPLDQLVPRFFRLGISL